MRRARGLPIHVSHLKKQVLEMELTLSASGAIDVVISDGKMRDRNKRKTVVPHVLDEELGEIVMIHVAGQCGRGRSAIVHGRVVPSRGKQSRLPYDKEVISVEVASAEHAWNVSVTDAREDDHVAHVVEGRTVDGLNEADVPWVERWVATDEAETLDDPVAGSSHNLWYLEEDLGKFVDVHLSP